METQEIDIVDIPELGIVELELDRRRTLRFKLRTLRKVEPLIGSSAFILLCEIEKAQKKRLAIDPSPENVGLAVLDILDMGKIVPLFWAALLHEDPSITIEEAEDLIELAPGRFFSDKFGNVVRAVYRAFMSFWITDSKKKEILEGSRNGTGIESRSSPTALSASSPASSGS